MVRFNQLNITPDGLKVIIDVSVKEDSYYQDVYLQSIVIDTQDTYSTSGPSSTPVYKKELSYEDSSWVFNPQEIFADNYVENGFPVWNQESSLWNYESSPFTAESLEVANKVFKYQDNYWQWNKTDIQFGEAFLEDGQIDFSYFTQVDPQSYRPINHPKSTRLEIDLNELLVASPNNLYFVYVQTIGNPSADTPCGLDNQTTLGITTYYYPLYQKAISYVKQLNDTCNIPKDFINFILQYKAFQLSIKAGHYIESIKYWNKLYSSINNINITSKCNCHG